jgi:pimeloyl-ACP methyl ester carboxylesterase
MFRADKRPEANMLGDFPDPATLPDWLTERDLDYYAAEFENSGFRGPLNRYRNQQRDWERLAKLNGARIRRPACFIAGRRDGVLKFVPNFDMVENMKRWTDDLRVCEIIEGAGHWIQQERPAEVTKLLLSFLGTLEKPGLRTED